MSDLEGDQRWETRRLWKPQSWLIAFLLLVIAGNELQRTWAQAEAHRQRVELAITMAELNRKMDWLLFLTPPPTSTGGPPLRPPAPASLVRSR